MKINEFLPWSDNWFIEGDSAWCVDGERNYLYGINVLSGEFTFIMEIPDHNPNKYRMNPHCIKYQDAIFCMPDRGENIWVYNVKNSQFRKIEIANSNGVRIAIVDFWQCEERIYAVSNGLKQVIEIDAKKEKIENYYTLCLETNIELSKSVMVDGVIYSVCMGANEIYQFDIKTKSVMKSVIQNMQGGFRTICFDKQKFWLSGCRKEIYVWHKERNIVIILNKFPERFGRYNIQNQKKDFLDLETVEYDGPIFIQSVALGQNVWFVSFFMNQIICVDKDSLTISVLEIEEESETRESFMSRKFKVKFILEYVKDNRYIGIFSTKNNCIIEIDSIEKSYEKKYFSFQNQFIEEAMKIYGNLVFSENDEMDRLVFDSALRMYIQEKTKQLFIGNKIHQIISK